MQQLASVSERDPRTLVRPEAAVRPCGKKGVAAVLRGDGLAVAEDPSRPYCPGAGLGWGSDLRSHGSRRRNQPVGKGVGIACVR